MFSTFQICQAFSAAPVSASSTRTVVSSQRPPTPGTCREGALNCYRSIHTRWSHMSACSTARELRFERVTTTAPSSGSHCAPRRRCWPKQRTTRRTWRRFTTLSRHVKYVLMVSYWILLRTVNFHDLTILFFVSRSIIYLYRLSPILSRGLHQITTT